MQTIRILQKTAANGVLSLEIPLGKPETEYEVVVVVQPKNSRTTPTDQGWPPGYFESTYGSIDDDTFIRHPQGEFPKPVELG